jgi:hypothetical protein
MELFENPRSWKVFRESVEQINNLTREANVKLAAVIFPLFGLPLDQKYPFHPIHSKIGSLLSELNISYLDLYQSFEGVPLDIIQVIPGQDRHPNEIGHRIAAEKIYAWLESKSLIPPELVIKQKYKGRTQIVNETPYR